MIEELASTPTPRVIYQLVGYRTFVTKSTCGGCCTLHKSLSEPLGIIACGFQPGCQGRCTGVWGWTRTELARDPSCMGGQTRTKSTLLMTLSDEPVQYQNPYSSTTECDSSSEKKCIIFTLLELFMSCLCMELPVE